ncbi:MAG: hypothetical protein VYB33_01375, partial [Pseudomonadota bacterium]|nr:hypothetical protein [Pseudomonadota bacterium]
TRRPSLKLTRSNSAIDTSRYLTVFDLRPVLDQLSVPGNFEITVPQYFNFGVDVIDARAAEGDKTAYIWVDRSGGVVEHH